MFDFFSSETSLFILIIAIAVAFALIITGGNKFVESAVQIAKITGIPQIIIGATIVSIGTTLPEIFTSFIAASVGQTTMAVGNATGSILCNLALIFGITLCTFSTTVDKKQFMQKFIIISVSVILLIIFSLDGFIAVWEGCVLFAIFVAFISINIYSAIKQVKQDKSDGKNIYGDNSTNKTWVLVLAFIAGAISIAVGASLMIDAVSAVAQKAGVSEQVISLTVVALGTSLPELVTTVTSIKQNNTEISLGNILGANILNATLITGGSVLIANGIYIPSTDSISLIVSFGIILILIAVLALPIIVKNKTYRAQGVIFEILYFLYLVFLILQLTGIIPYSFA